MCTCAADGTATDSATSAAKCGCVTRPGPLYVQAPMVDASEAPFRLMVSRGAAIRDGGWLGGSLQKAPEGAPAVADDTGAPQPRFLTYTQMLHAAHLVNSRPYRTRWLDLSEKEGPVIVQVSASEPATFAAATALLSRDEENFNLIAGVELNLGCPQRVARKGGYGAFLLEETEQAVQVLADGVAASRIPVFAKIRLLRSGLDDTLRLCRAIQATGVSVLTVHGRNREQKGRDPGPADLDAIRAIVEALDIPVVSNGGVHTSPTDVALVLDRTGAAGHMCATRLLDDPLTFFPALSAAYRPVDKALLYLEYVAAFPTVHLRQIKLHLFAFCRSDWDEHPQCRAMMASSRTTAQMRAALDMLRIAVGVRA